MTRLSLKALNSGENITVLLILTIIWGQNWISLVSDPHKKMLIELSKSAKEKKIKSINPQAAKEDNVTLSISLPRSYRIIFFF